MTQPAIPQPDTRLKHFIPLPSDPALLTIEHVRTAFAGDWSALKEVVSTAQKTDRDHRLIESA